MSLSSLFPAPYPSSPCSCPRPSRSEPARHRVPGGARPSPRARGRGERGQTTAEYALVLLGAATIAMLVVTWAGSSGAIGSLFDAVVSHVIGAVK